MKMQTQSRRQSGLVTVEFALIGAFFFLILFSIIEFGRLLFTWNTLDEVTRRAARLAAVCPIRGKGAGGGGLLSAPLQLSSSSCIFSVFRRCRNHGSYRTPPGPAFKAPILFTQKRGLSVPKRVSLERSRRYLAVRKRGVWCWHSLRYRSNRALKVGPAGGGAITPMITVLSSISLHT